MSSPDVIPVLAIDVGNSRIKAGLYSTRRLSLDESLNFEERCALLPREHCSLTVPHDNPFPWEELSSWPEVERGKVHIAVMAGVRPQEMRNLAAEWPRSGFPRLQEVTDYRQLNLSLGVEFPERVGIDRLLNAVAANACRPPERPIVVVDSGTATTVDLISADGQFAGGAILPGLALGARALHHYTALLPLLTPEEIAPAAQAPPVCGRNTRQAITSGLYWGQVGAVRELIARLNPAPAPLVLCTGGDGRALARQLTSLEEVRFIPHLPLVGLALVASQQGV